MVVACQACGQKNRVPARHLAHSGRCGKCHATLPAADAPMEVDAATFDEIVSQARVPVLVDFWAEWCGPCRMAAPQLQRVAREMQGKALVLKVNTEREPALAQRFGVRSIPNFVVMKDGRPVMQQPGLVDHGRMRAWLEAA